MNHHPSQRHNPKVILSMLLASIPFQTGSGQVPPPSPVSSDAVVSHKGRPLEILDGQPFTLHRAFPEASDANMLTFRLHSEQMSGARVHLKILAPDLDHCYVTSFAIQWTGWNAIQVEKVAFYPQGNPSWSDVQGLHFSGEQGPLSLTSLRLADVSWSHSTPAWDLEYGERLIEATYHRPFAPYQRWRPVMEESGPQKGTVGFTWASITFKLDREGDPPHSATFMREFQVEISDCQAVRIQASLPIGATIGMSARIDGEIQEICPPQPGTGYWHEYRGPIHGKTLEALYLHCGEQPSPALTDPPEAWMFSLHFVTLETEAFDPPQYPEEEVRRPLPTARKPREPLLEAGLPVWLYFGREDIPAIRQRVRDGDAGLSWNDVINEADHWIGDDPSPYEGGYWPVTGHEWERAWYPSTPDNRNWDTQACACAFAYLLTEDMRYAEQAKRYLLAASTLVKWNYGMISRHPIGWGGHGGPFAEASKGALLVLAYNWIHNTLTDEERRTIEEAMLYKSWYWLHEYIERAHYIHAMNQGPWFNWGALMHALMLRDTYPFLNEHIPRYEANIRKSIDLCYYEDGSNTEGPAYWGATTRFIAYSLPLIAHAHDRPLAELVPQRLVRSIETPIYLRSMAREGFSLLAINDAQYGEWYPEATGLFFATLLDDPLARWAITQTTRNTQPWAERFGLDDLLSFLWAPREEPAVNPKLALARQFQGSAGIVCRSGWDVGDVLFCMQTGAWGSGHQHPDKNAFILEAYRERLCPDAGIGQYGGATTAAYQRTNAHNTITFNGEDQKPADPKVLTFLHTQDYDYIESDATANYPGAVRVLRRVLYRRPGYFVISDEITTNQPFTIAFNLHTFCDVTTNGDAFNFEGKHADMLMKVVSPAHLASKVVSVPYSTQENRLRKVQLEPLEPVTEMHYLTVLYPLPKESDRPEITSEQTSAGWVIRVDRDAIEWTPGNGLRLK